MLRTDTIQHLGWTRLNPGTSAGPRPPGLPAGCGTDAIVLSVRLSSFYFGLLFQDALSFIFFLEVTTYTWLMPYSMLRKGQEIEWLVACQVCSIRSSPITFVRFLWYKSQASCLERQLFISQLRSILRSSKLKTDIRQMHRGQAGTAR